MPGLSVIIITLNEERNILRALESVKPVAGEIVVVDSHSTDRTAEICREQGCRVFLKPFAGYGPQKQFAVAQCANDWIMYLDADEVLTPGLQQELSGIFSMPGRPVDGYSAEIKSGIESGLLSGLWVQSYLSYMGRILKHSGVGKEFHLRLFNRCKGAFNNQAVHEGIEVSGETARLKGKVIHYSYRNIAHHLEKINHYSNLASEEYVTKGRSFSKGWIPLKFTATFITLYLIRGGFLDGYPGFMWSFMAAIYTALKVAKTVEISKRS